MNETKPKKMVSRNVAIVLGIICVVLVTVISIGAYAFYTPIINNKDNTISSLESQATLLNTEVASESTTISSLNDSLVILQGQVSNIYIQGTKNSTLWMPLKEFWISQGSGSSYFITPEQNVSSSGYVSILVASNNTSTSVQYVYYEYYDSAGIFIGWNQTIQIGLFGIAVFPVQPTSSAWISFYSPLGSSNINATATYYY